VCIYVDGVLKKEADLRMPNLGDSFTNIRIGAAVYRPANSVQPSSSYSSVSSTLTAPFSNLKNVLGGLTYKSGATEKVTETTTTVRLNLFDYTSDS
jgi:hypothetical protein